MNNVLPELISSNQTAYIRNRCISEKGNLISEVIEMCDILDIPCYLVTMDIEKALDSLYQYFLLFALKSFIKQTTIMSYIWGFFNSIFQLG